MQVAVADLLLPLSHRFQFAQLAFFKLSTIFFPQDELSDSPSSLSKRRPLLLKKGLTKRRLALLHTDVAETLSRVPQLRYTLTAEELEQDRQAERERILRTLDEVEEELQNGWKSCFSIVNV
jgi:hypothetical protein